MTAKLIGEVRAPNYQPKTHLYYVKQTRPGVLGVHEVAMARGKGNKAK